MFSITLLIGVSMAGLLGWRLWRARGSRHPATRLLSVRARQPMAKSRHRPLQRTPGLGIWQPPPRQRLLDRQSAQWLAAATSMPERPSHPRQMSWGTAESRRLANSKGTAFEPVHPAQIEHLKAQRVESAQESRIGRKRRGLESLITEIPSAAEGKAHESNTR